MSLAYLHLLTNHLPILGVMFAVLLLVFAVINKQQNTTFSAYLIMLVAGIGGIIAYFTGEAAEESVEHLPGISEKIIHLHEEMAENVLLLIFLLTASSVLGIWAHVSGSRYAKKFETYMLVLGIICFVLFAFTGYLGGHIRHGN
ncbi:MAG: hypothetical protein RLZZ301_146 [Bacteroidota bacterium]|jgi:uncharacterized membrane protein